MARRETFTEAFNPYLQNTASMISRMLIGNSEREKDYEDWKKRKDYERSLGDAELQSRADALAKYQAGGETVLTDTPDILGTKPTKSNFGLNVNIPNQENIVIPERKSTYKNYSPSERIRQGLLAGVTSNEILNDLKPPKPQDIYEGYLEKLHKRYGRNKYTNQLEVVQDYGEGYNPAFNDWKENEIPNSAYKDSKTGKWFKKIGYQDIDTGEWKTNEKGEHVLKGEKQFNLTKTGTNGEKLFSKEINENFNQYKKSTNDLLVLINSGVDPETGTQATPEQMKGWKTELGQTTENYSNLVKNTGSSRFNKFVNDIYNGTDGGKKPKTNAVPLVYWNKLLKDGKKYGFTPKDFQSGYNLFISTYKADPLELYGVSDFDEYFEEDDNSNVDEQEE